MAGYRQHISVSGILGVVYGGAATWIFGFTPIQGTIAFMLTWFAGMLPDIDSQTGRPVQEIFGAVSVLAPLVLMQHMNSWGGEPERVLLLSIFCYLIVRNGGPYLLGKLSVHRGMYHSIPVMLIFSLGTFLAYKHHDVAVRSLMGIGVGLGFLSHLILDEIYSVQWTGTKIKLAKSAGSAMKWFGNNAAAAALSWGCLMFLTILTLNDLGFIDSGLEGTDLEAVSVPGEQGEDQREREIDLGSADEFPGFL